MNAYEGWRHRNREHRAESLFAIMAEMRDTVEWHICSRNKETLEQVGKKYDFKDVNAVK